MDGRRTQAFARDGAGSLRDPLNDQPLPLPMPAESISLTSCCSGDLRRKAELIRQQLRGSGSDWYLISISPVAAPPPPPQRNGPGYYGSSTRSHAELSISTNRMVVHCTAYSRAALSNGAGVN